MLWFLLSLFLLIAWAFAAFAAVATGGPSNHIDSFVSRLAHWYKNPKDPVRLAAYGALCLSVLIGVLGYYELLPLPQKLIDDFYANGAAELASIAITILVIDRLVEWRAEQREKESIIRQLGSHSNAFALEAVRIATDKGWTQDGTLEGLDIERANLTGANLHRARLSHITFYRCNLSQIDLFRADLSGAYLRRVTMVNAQLLQANLSNAFLNVVDLQGAKMKMVNLQDAILRNVNLADALFDETCFDGARYTNDTKWPKGFDPAAHGAKLVDDEW